MLAAKPVDDEILLTINFTLPGGFGFLMNELHLNIEVDTASDWGDTAVLRQSRPTPQLNLFDYFTVFDFPLVGRNGVQEQLRCTQTPSGTLIRTPFVPVVSGSTQSMSAQNTAAAVGAAGVLNFVASFWAYDLEQIAWWPTHSVVLDSR